MNIILIYNFIIINNFLDMNQITWNLQTSMNDIKTIFVYVQRIIFNY